MTLAEMKFAITNLQKSVIALAKRNYGERAEQALSEATRVEQKEDSSIEELDAGLADATLMICELMKGE